MPNFSNGPAGRKRATQLLSAILAFANDQLTNTDDLTTKIEINWKSATQLIVKAEIRFLELLTERYGTALNGDHIREALKQIENLVGILEDNRSATQGKSEWHFTLTLWHNRWDKDENLATFEKTWNIQRDLKVAKRPGQPRSKPSPTSAQSLSISSTQNTYQDWGEALDIKVLYGRIIEQAELKRWILVDQCRLVMLLGIGGIGKTSLSIYLAEQIQGEFEYLIWRSLRNAPSIQTLLADINSVLSDHQETQTNSVDAQISLLIGLLRTSRCLLILDNFESILQSHERSGTYPQGYEGYGQLLRSIGETRHQSCLIITSREKPRNLSAQESQTSSIRSLRLDGLASSESIKIFKDKGISVSSSEGKILTQQYAGNPLALKIVATTIQEIFNNDAELFLTEGTSLFGDISDLLAQQFSRLTDIEKSIMYWLSIYRDWVNLLKLGNDMYPRVPRPKLIEAIDSLQRRSLLEKKESKFGQQTVVMEFVTEELITNLCEDIYSQKINLLDSYPIGLGQAKEYLIQAQTQLILKPLVQQLVDQLGHSEHVNQRLNGILQTLKAQPARQPGYAAGNILKLLAQLNADLSKYDFSKLTLWQVYFPQLNIQGINFSGADVSRSVFNQTNGAILSAAFSPSGTYMATGIGQEVVVWELESSKPLFSCRGHQDWVVALAFSPDEQTIASGSRDGTVRLWNSQTGQCLKTLHGHQQGVLTVAFSPHWDPTQNQHLLASGSYDHTVRLWNGKTGEVVSILEGHHGRVLAIALSVDGHTLVSSSADQTLRVWNIQTGNCLQTFPINVNWVQAMALSPDGQTLATGCDRKGVKLWDIKTGKCLGSLSDYQDEVWTVDFSSDGQILVTGGETTGLKLWNVQTKSCLRTIHDHQQRVWFSAFNQQIDRLASCSDDQTLKLWEVETGQCLSSLQTYTNAVNTIAISPGGNLLASGSEDHLIRLWSTASRDYLKCLKGHTNMIGSIAFSPDSQMLVSGSDDHFLKLWDLSTGDCIKTLEGHQQWITSVTFHPNKHLIASSSHDGTIKVWDIKSGECLLSLDEHHNRVKAVTFSTDGQLLISGGDDQTLKVWDTKTGQCLRTLEEHKESVLSVAVSPNGQWLASGSSDTTLKLWNIETGRCEKTFSGHTQQIRSVQFSPDNQWLASGSSDTTLKLWNIETEQCIQTFTGHTQVIWAIAFYPDIRQLASSSSDGSIRIWALNSGKCLSVLIPLRPYEKVNITDTVGLTNAQRATLKTLGASETTSSRNS